MLMYCKWKWKTTLFTTVNYCNVENQLLEIALKHIEEYLLLIAKVPSGLKI